MPVCPICAICAIPKGPENIVHTVHIDQETANGASFVDALLAVSLFAEFTKC